MLGNRPVFLDNNHIRSKYCRKVNIHNAKMFSMAGHGMFMVRRPIEIVLDVKIEAFGMIVWSVKKCLSLFLAA